MSREEPQERRIPVQWHIPDDFVGRYATNMQVHHSEHEFVLSFFEAQMPALSGSPDEVSAQLQELDSIRADCVARITVAASRMPEFLKALQSSWDGYVSAIKESE